MSVLRLPTPAGWNDGRRTFAWACLAVMAFCSWFLYWGFVGIAGGDYLTATVAFGLIAIPLTALVAGGLVAFGKVVTRITYDSTGTVLWPNKLSTLLALAAAATTIPAGILFAIFTPRGEIGIPMSRGMQIFSPALIGFAVAIAVIGLISAWRRGGVGYLKLLPSGIEFANIFFTKHFSWDEIIDVKDSAEKKKTNRAIVLHLHDRPEEVIEGVDSYVPHGAALYWMVRHYFRHPDDRSELTDGCAVSRLRDGLFDFDES